MKLKCLCCESLARMAYASAAISPHVVDVELFEIGLHNKPLNLRQQLQTKIDEVSSHGYDAITLAYGLCGQATAGLKASTTQLVIPRAHDCITLFLGSRSRYMEQFEKNPGTYWYALDYIQRRDSSGTSLALGSGVDTSNLDATYLEYVEKYGQDNADYLMEVMGAWQSHYNRAVFIDVGVGDGTPVAAIAQAEAERRGWNFEQMAGNITLIQRFLSAQWDEDFLVIAPGQQIVMSYDEKVIGCRLYT